MIEEKGNGNLNTQVSREHSWAMHASVWTARQLCEHDRENEACVYLLLLGSERAQEWPEDWLQHICGWH